MVEDDGHGPVASDGGVVLEAVPVADKAVDLAVVVLVEADQAVVEVDPAAVAADPVAVEAEDTLPQIQQGQDTILTQPRSSGLNRT